MYPSGVLLRGTRAGRETRAEAGQAGGPHRSRGGGEGEGACPTPEGRATGQRGGARAREEEGGASREREGGSGGESSVPVQTGE